MTGDPRLLHKAMDETWQALTDLCDPPRRAIWREDVDPETGVVLGFSGLTHHEAPSLLNQLREEVAGSGGRPGGPRRSAPIPVAVDALDLWNSIGAGSVKLVELTGAHLDGFSVEHAIRMSVAAVGQSVDVEAVLGVRNALQGWVKAIRTLLDPQKRVPLWGQSCPLETCGAGTVWREDESDGELKRTAALEVTFGEDQNGSLVAKECRCLACGEEWPRSRLLFLARLLGRDVSGVEEGEPAA